MSTDTAVKEIFVARNLRKSKFVPKIVSETIRGPVFVKEQTISQHAVPVEKSLMAESCACQPKAAVRNARHE